MLCQQWGTLPATGGLDAQFVRRLSTMTSALNVYKAFQSYNEKQIGDAEFSRQYPRYWRMIVEVELG